MTPNIHYIWRGAGDAVWDVPVQYSGMITPIFTHVFRNYFPCLQANVGVLPRHGHKPFLSKYHNQLQSAKRNLTKRFPHTDFTIIPCVIAIHGTRSGHCKKSHENRMWLCSFAHSYYSIFYSKSNVMAYNSDERSGKTGSTWFTSTGQQDLWSGQWPHLKTKNTV